MTERDSLNSLAQQLANDAGQRLIKIPGIRAVCVTFVGDEEIPLGAFIYDNEHQDAGTVLKAIERLTQHVNLLVRALGTYERDHREGVGGKGHDEAEPDRLCRALGTTSSHHGSQSDLHGRRGRARGNDGSCTGSILQCEATAAVGSAATTAAGEYSGSSAKALHKSLSSQPVNGTRRP